MTNMLATRSTHAQIKEFVLLLEILVRAGTHKSQRVHRAKISSLKNHHCKQEAEWAKASTWRAGLSFPRRILLQVSKLFLFPKTWRNLVTWRVAVDHLTYRWFVISNHQSKYEKIYIDLGHYCRLANNYGFTTISFGCPVLITSFLDDYSTGCSTIKMQKAPR